jgi:hypothetical protein
MKRLVLLASKLYPRQWRSRYGNEFEALIEDSQATGIRELFDILKGATTMRLTQSPLPIIGIFTLAGTFAMAVVWVAIPNMYRSEGTFAIPTGATRVAINEAATDALDSHQLQPFLQKYGFDSPEAVEKSKGRITIRKAEPVAGHASEQLVGVHFDDEDPVRAQAVAKEVMDRLVQRLNARGMAATVTDAPARPTIPIAPALKKLLEMGVSGGLMLGVLAAIARKLATPATPGVS